MPASAWKGVLVADHLGSVCLQGSVTAPLGGEDCLYLNICKPAGASAGSRSRAILWVHGGGYNGGSGGVFDGSALAKRENMIVITINYRLRALGFLAHPTLETAAKDGVVMATSLGCTGEQQATVACLSAPGVGGPCCDPGRGRVQPGD